ncbi:hypothetical protein [Psychromonas ossibalaenae]|uniref:hypothetical protein n=1 Tax=Psychromonas ossibalaenae TaxID=444922 RepID=UPI000367EED7|nr:hypothetical protein [Psychromonas ossibalaenae]
MAKLWLTDQGYSFWASLCRIIYWLGAVYLSSLYLQHYSQFSWFKVGLILISVTFVVGFLLLGRCLDHLFKLPKS